jgi:hypothetical protein
VMAQKLLKKQQKNYEWPVAFVDKVCLII